MSSVGYLLYVADTVMEVLSKVLDKDRLLSVTRKTSYSSDSYYNLTDKKNTEQSLSSYQDERCSYEHDTIVREV